MLTIENFEKKLIGKAPSNGKWYVAAVEETPYQYHIHATMGRGNNLNRINIERLSMNEEGVMVYELWWWDNNEPDPAKQKPIRKMLSVYDFRVGYGALIELIDYMLKLK